MSTACLLIHAAGPSMLPEGTGADDAAARDGDAVAEHLAMAGSLLGVRLVTAVALEDVAGGRPVTLVAAGDGARDDLERLAGESPLDGGGWRSWLGGVDRDALAGVASERPAPAGYVDLVLDPGRPPVPFDDPTVVGVLRASHAWFLPLIGERHVSCEAIWWDGVRAAGGFAAFTAGSDGEAQWLAEQHPWRRVAPGRLLRHPEGVFVSRPPPAGPGTQRSAFYVCGRPSSTSEPGVGAGDG